MQRRGRNAVLINSCVAWFAVAALGCGGSDQPNTASATPASDETRATTAPPEFSYEPYAHVLAAYVHESGLVDYQGLTADSEPLFQFNDSLVSIDREAFDVWSEKERLAFWINVYNSITLEYIVRAYPIEPSGLTRRVLYPNNSIRQIPGVWDEKTMRIIDRDLTLDEIEHEILRVEFDEPRIHVAINCASIGCPPLPREPFRAERLDAQLADQSRRFLADPTKFRIDREANRVYLSPIFKWFGQDFVGVYNTDNAISGHDESVNAVLAYAAEYIDDKNAHYLKAGDYRVSFLDYDWSLNEHPSE